MVNEGMGEPENIKAQEPEESLPAEPELVDPDKVKITAEGVAYTVKNGFLEGLVYLVLGFFEGL